MRMVQAPDGTVHGGVGVEETLCGQKAPWLSDFKREVNGWKYTRWDALEVPGDCRCRECYAQVEQGIAQAPPVKVGDIIYVPTALYMSHGADDFLGGKATVSRVTIGISAGKPVPQVSILERPSTQYNWAMLAEKQADLALEFGDEFSRPDPDYRPEFNRWD